MAREMKDSGIEWIGKIPQEWKTIKVKYTSWLKGRIGWQGLTASEYVDEGPFLVTGTDFQNGEVNWSSCAHISKERFNEDSDIHIKEGDLLITKDGTVGKVAIAKDCPEEVSLNSGVLLIRNIGNYKYHDKYLYYVLLSDEFWRWYTLSQVGQSTIKHLYQAQFYSFEYTYPPFLEQKRIADFLDRECARIDTVIEKTRASIEEYKKLKQSVITQAVTKGIRSDRKMKDSGVEWIGDIPVDWAIVNAHKIIISTQNGLTRRDLDQSSGQIVLKLKNISSNGSIDYSYINRIELSKDELEKYALQEGDFLFVRVNGSKSLVGKCAIFSELREPVAYNDHIIRVRMNRLIDRHFFQFYLLSNVGRTEIDLRTSTAAGQFTISGEGLREINVILPPVTEQREISSYVERKCLELDSLITKKEQLLLELDRYKKAFIFEYVTGKKEVV